MKINYRLTLLVIAIFFTTIDVHAQETEDVFDLSLEQLMNMEIITASKVAEKTSDAPGIISTITALEIEKFGAQSLVDVLDRVTGTVNMSSFVRPQNVTSFRGDLSTDYDTHTLILINGRPNRESLYGGWNSSILTSIPINAVDRIEIIRGPGSVLYGSNAYSGVINIILKKGGESMNKVSTYIGSFGGVGVDAYVGLSKNELNVMVGYKYFKEDGWDFTATDVVDSTETIKYSEENYGFTLNADYKGLTFSGLITHSDQAVFSAVAPFWTYDPDVTIDSRRTMADLGYELEYSENASTKVNVTYNGFDVNLPGNSVGESDDYLFEVNNFVSIADKLNIVVGGTYYIQTGVYSFGDFVLVPEYTNVWANGYAQVDYRPIAELKLIAGLQVNKIEGLNTNIVPRFGAIYNITDKLGTKVLYGHAFRAAYGYESGINVGEFLFGNPNLQPEILKNLDVQLFYNTKNLELAATVFSNRKEDNITRQGPTFNNSGVNKSAGLELEGKLIPTSNIYLTGSYAYQTNELELADGSVLEEASLMPNHVLKLGFGYQTKNGISLGLYNMYVSEFNQLNETGAFPVVNGDTGGFNSISANLNINIPKLFDMDMKQEIILGLSGSNLLDESISTPEFAAKRGYSIPGRPGRTLYATLSVKF